MERSGTDRRRSGGTPHREGRWLSSPCSYTVRSGGRIGGKKGEKEWMENRDEDDRGEEQVGGMMNRRMEVEDGGCRAVERRREMEKREEGVRKVGEEGVGGFNSLKYI